LHSEQQENIPVFRKIHREIDIEFNIGYDRLIKGDLAFFLASIPEI